MCLTLELNDSKEFERIGDLIAMPPRGLGTILTH